MNLKIPQIKGKARNLLMLLGLTVGSTVFEHKADIQHWAMLWPVVSDALLHAVIVSFGWIAMSSNWKETPKSDE